MWSCIFAQTCERNAPRPPPGNDQMTRGLNILTAFPFQEQSVAQPLSPVQGVPELVALTSFG